MQHGIVGTLGALMSVATLLGGSRLVSQGMDQAVVQAETQVVMGRFQQMEGAVQLARLKLGPIALRQGDIASLAPRFLKHAVVADTIDPSRRDEPDSRTRLDDDLSIGTDDAAPRYIVMPLGDSEASLELCASLASLSSSDVGSDAVPKGRSGCSRTAGGWSAWRRFG
jgi:hypothetical protein